MKIFSTKGAEKRKQHGSKGSTVFRDPNENDRVWVLFDWDARGLAELRLRPGGPGDHARGRPHGPAAGRRSSAASTGLDVDPYGSRSGTFDPEAADAGPLRRAPPAAATRNLPVGLTKRELEVLLVLVRGVSNEEIAEHLGISAKTVGHHVQHVYRKAGVHSRAAATLWAFEHGLVRTRSGRHVA